MQTRFWREYSKQMLYCIALRQHAFKHCCRTRGQGTHGPIWNAWPTLPNYLITCPLDVQMTEYLNL